MDQFVAAYKDALSKYAQFSGRLSVGGYWRFFLVNFLIGLVFNLLGQAASIFAIVGLIYALAVFIPGLAAAVRRLHDTNKSGWFILIGIIPIIGWILIIVWLVKAGDAAANQYGPPTA